MKILFKNIEENENNDSAARERVNICNNYYFFIYNCKKIFFLFRIFYN